MTRAVWAVRYAETAREHWTAERTAELTGGKRLAIVPAEAPLLLRALGLLDGDAAMSPSRVRKFLQINHLVRLIEPAFEELRARHPVIRVLDAGCGRSYLTLLLAWCARERWNHPLSVLGVDRDPDVIAECRRRTAIAELDDVVRFEAADLVMIDTPVHAVVALHACDTATCDAIAAGVKTGAEIIAVAPCCQAELARAWTLLADTGAPGSFAPIWNAGHLRRETAAHITDAMRTLLLRAAGYQVTALELVAEGHSTKNTLIRAIRSSPNAAARAEYDALVESTGGCGLALASRI